MKEYQVRYFIKPEALQEYLNGFATRGVQIIIEKMSAESTSAEVDGGVWIIVSYFPKNE